VSDVSGLQRHATAAVTRGAPTLVTERLALRELRLDDAAAVADGAGDRRVARFLIQVPTPYPVALARRWAQARIAWWTEGRGVTLAITRRTQTRQLLGTVSLRRFTRDRRAELGYWLAANAWNFGFATEACRAIVDFGFRELELARIYAQVLAGNDASEHVLDKLGMLRFQLPRIELGLVRARIVLCDARRPVGPRLAELRGLLDVLAKEHSPWLDGVIALLRASGAVLAGDVDAALAHLVTATDLLGQAGMLGHVQVARLRRGELEGGAVGTARAAAARDLLKDLGAVDPDRLAQLLVPMPG